MGDLGINVRIILKWIIEIQSVKFGPGWKRLRMGSIDGNGSCTKN
jgi:hypothetical protein